MNRLFAVGALMFATVAPATAGAVYYVGQGSQGLTNAYLNGSSSCIGTGTPGNTGCFSPGAVGNSNTNFNHMTGNLTYQTTLFQAATLSSSPITAPNGYTTPGQLESDMSTGGTFQMIDDTSSTHNAWADGNTLNTITIPVGVFGVNIAYTMIQDLQGLDGNTINVTFNFNSASGTVDPSGGTDGNSVTFALSEGPSGQVRAGLVCSTTAPGETSGQMSACNTLTSTTMVPMGLGNYTQPGTGYTVTPGNVFSTSYDAALGTYAGTVGTAVLDDQEFNFNNAFNGEFLVDIVIHDTASSTVVSANSEKFALSAVTVDSVLPEPSTYALFGIAMIALLGFQKLRRTREIDNRN